MLIVAKNKNSNVTGRSLYRVLQLRFYTPFKNYVYLVSTYYYYACRPIGKNCEIPVVLRKSGRVLMPALGRRQSRHYENPGAIICKLGVGSIVSAY